MKSIVPTDLLTPAEYLALHQVLTSGSQSIQLSSAGKATGGTFKVDLAIGEAIASLGDRSSSDAQLSTGHGKSGILPADALNDDEYIQVDGSDIVISGAAVVVGGRRRKATSTPILPAQTLWKPPAATRADGF